MPVIDPSPHPDALRLAARQAHVARQLDLMIDDRGPVEQVKRLIADLDRISADLSQALRGREAARPRQDR